MTSDKTYHLTRDGRLVPEGDPDGVMLVARAGCHVGDDVVRRYGLPREFAAKAVVPAENKAVRPASNKASAGKGTQ